MFDYGQFLADSKHHFRAHAVVDNVDLNSSPYPRRKMEDQLRKAMAAYIAQEKVTERIGEYTTTLELELLVFTPDEFAGILRAAARDYAMSPLHYSLSAGEHKSG